MSKWKDISTAPKDRVILGYGQPGDIDGMRFAGPSVHSIYWDEIDSAFCLTGSTWVGPFINPTHWMPLPSPPKPINPNT